MYAFLNSDVFKRELDWFVDKLQHFSALHFCPVWCSILYIDHVHTKLHALVYTICTSQEFIYYQYYIDENSLETTFDSA